MKKSRLTVMHSSNRHLRVILAAAAFALMVLMVGALLHPVLAQAEAIDLGAPLVDKAFAKNQDGSLQVDEEGNYTLQLSVTGKSQSTSTSSKAYVIFVADVSGSMKNRYGDTTRLAAAKSSINAAAQTILNQNSAADQTLAEVKLITFSTRVVNNYDWTNGINTFKSQVNSMTAEGGTNWEAALLQAETEATSITDGAVYVIFVSDGEPTYRLSQIYSDEDYEKYTATRWNGRERVWVYPNEGPLYYDDKNNDVTGVYGEGDADPKGWNFAAANIVADRLVDGEVHALYTINVGDAESMDSLAASRHFEASSPTELQSALSAIVSEITYAYSYKNVLMTDYVTIGDTVLGVADGGGVSGFTYTITDAGGNTTTWADAPEASYDPSTKAVTWDLGKMVLQNGTTYTVSFKVRLTQQAFDDAAKLANGQTAISSNVVKVSSDGSDIVAYANPSAGNTVAYTQFMTENGVEQPDSEKDGVVDLPRPELTVSTSTLTLTKSWNGSGTGADSLTLHVEDSAGVFSQDVVLVGSSWTKTIYVAAGPEGHSYTVTEPSVPAGWVLEGYALTGLIPSGSDTNSGTLKGLNAQSAGVTVTNKQIKYAFRILKQGSDGAALSGAIFSVSGSGSQATGEDSLVTFGQLLPGTYTVAEEKVPSGYTLPGTHTLVISIDGTATWDGIEITNTGVDQGVKYFQTTVTNEKIAELPKTGGIGIAPFAVVGAALVIAGGLALLKREEKGH